MLDVKNQKKNYAFALALIIILAFILRYYRASIADLWSDEAFSYWLSSQNITVILDCLYKFDAHPPLFYFFLHWWIKFGSSPLLLRLPGIILGSLSLIGVYLLGKELINKEVGITAAFLTAVSAFHVSMCREIRMYAYLSFFVIFAFYFFVKLFNKDQRPATSDGRTQGSAPTWILYTLFMIISWYIHYLGIFITILHNIIVLLFNRRINTKYWIYSQLAILICYIPWYKYLFYQIFDQRGPGGQFFSWQNIFMIPVLSFTSPLVNFMFDKVLFWGIFAGILIILALSVINHYKNKYFLAVTFIGFFALPLLFILKAGLTGSGSFIARYFAFVAPLYFIIVAASFIKNGKVKTFLAFVILLSFLTLNFMGLYNLYYVKGFSPQRWREAITYLEKYYENKDGIILQNVFQKYPFNYYFKQKHDEYFVSDADLLKLPGIVKNHKRIWLIMSFAGECDPQRKVLKWLVSNCNAEQAVVYENFTQPNLSITLILFTGK